VLFGLLAGFGRSPYSHTFELLTLNVWFVGTRLIGVEVVRWYLGRTLGRLHPALGYLAAWLIPLLCLITLGQYSQLATPESALRVTGQTFLPAAAENFLAACLALAAGPLASIAYRGVLLAFEWLSPILPDLPWIGAAFVGVLVPVVGVALLNHQAEPSTQARAEAAGQAGQAAQPASAASWLLVVPWPWASSGSTAASWASGLHWSAATA
jgi:signal peptidase